MAFQTWGKNSFISNKTEIKNKVVSGVSKVFFLFFFAKKNKMVMTSRTNTMNNPAQPGSLLLLLIWEISFAKYAFLFLKRRFN